MTDTLKPCPNQNQLLTDEQIFEILKSVDKETVRLPAGVRLFARAIETAVLSASAVEKMDEFEVVGKVVLDTHFGWHVRVTKDWDNLGNGTILYAARKSNQEGS